jgi:zinc transporter
MEETVLDDATARLRAELAEIRRSAIVLRRFMFPQRDALTTLQIEDLSWLDERERGRIREAAERVTRLAEELDAIRDRAAIVHDQVTDQRAEALNRSMLILAVVAAVFLPLGLITGLLGINVGGIPGSDYPYAFEIVCALLVLIAVGQVVLFIRLKLL